MMPPAGDEEHQYFLEITVPQKVPLFGPNAGGEILLGCLRVDQGAQLRGQVGRCVGIATDVTRFEQGGFDRDVAARIAPPL